MAGHEPKFLELSEDKKELHFRLYIGSAILNLFYLLNNANELTEKMR